MVKQNVTRFQIAVDDALFVRSIQCRADTFENVRRLINGNGAICQPVIERTAGHQAHDQEGLAVLFAKVINRHDGRMFQGGNGAGFTGEAGAEFRVMQKFTRQHFDGHRALELGIIRFVDRGHTAPAQFSFNFVTVDFFGDHRLLGNRVIE